MIRLLIADDEKIIRETICNIIDWKSLGIEVVAVCKDGLEAYDAILDRVPGYRAHRYPHAENSPVWN